MNYVDTDVNAKGVDLLLSGVSPRIVVEGTAKYSSYLKAYADAGAAVHTKDKEKIQAAKDRLEKLFGSLPDEYVGDEDVYHHGQMLKSLSDALKAA